MRPGQPSPFGSIYPDTECTGKVASIAQATGAEFAVLPPQNASGNWVKVVQRIPVRIAVKCQEGDPPLRVGMSTTIEIDTGPQPLDRAACLRAGSPSLIGLSRASATARRA